MRVLGKLECSNLQGRGRERDSHKSKKVFCWRVQHNMSWLVVHLFLIYFKICILICSANFEEVFMFYLFIVQYYSKSRSVG